MTMDTNSIDGELSISELEVHFMPGTAGGGNNAHNNSGTISFKSQYSNSYQDQHYKSSSTSFRYDTDAERDHIWGKKESRCLWCCKFVVVLILTLLATLVSTIVYYNVRTYDQELFESRYMENAHRIVSNVQQTIDRQHAILQNLAIHVVASSTPTTSSVATTWPFVTVPRFDTSAASAKRIMGRDQSMMGIVLTPVVAEEQREAYEAYTVENQDWIQQTMDKQQSTAGETNDGARARRNLSRLMDSDVASPRLLQIEELDSPQFHPPFIYSLEREDEFIGSPVPEVSTTSPSGLYFPVRQLYPLIPQMVNYNLAVANTEVLDGEDDPLAEGLTQAYYSKKAVLGKMILGTSSSSRTSNFTSDGRVLVESLWSPSHDDDADAERELIVPVSSIHTPVSDESNNELVVGMLTSLVNWNAMFSDILSVKEDSEVGGDIYESNEGYIVVLENACSQLYTFRIDGSESYFVGPGDFHNPEYNSLRYSYPVVYDNVEDDEYVNDMRDSPTTDWNDKYCPYTIHVYPSHDLEQSYKSNETLLYTLSVVVIFVVTTVVFLLYDCFVEKRAKKVMDVAVEARAVVSSLFPESVRDRLFEQRRKASGKVKNTGGQVKTPAATTAGATGGDGGNIELFNKSINSGSTGRDSGTRGSGAASTGGWSRISRRTLLSTATTNTSSSRKVKSPDNNKSNAVDNTELETGGGDMTFTEYGDTDDPSTFYNRFDQQRQRTSLNQSSMRLKSYLSVSSRGSVEINTNNSGVGGGLGHHDDKPIADLFPHTTVLFADIGGFTSWSSQRDPEQVFTLLQAIFKCFDKVARKRSVFKVETIGDCYVAATGLPEPQEDHAWRMCKFALECRSKMNDVTRDLEVLLGPDTGDLAMRFGLHSGAVTAGVLRGEKSRFQLFGDTVNFASRMESTGQISRIQLSESTADRLVVAGKSAWIRPRQDMVEAKGKGLCKTYWLASRPKHLKKTASKRRLSLEHTKSDDTRLKRRNSLSDFSSNSNDTSNDEAAAFTLQSRGSTRLDLRSDGLTEERNRRRVVNWQSELLARALKLIVAHRANTASQDDTDIDSLQLQRGSGLIVLDEVAKSIVLPDFDENEFLSKRNPASVLLGLSVVSQLHDYVTTIAGMYSKNAFHNFEHASHVSMSASKLLHRFIVPDCLDPLVAKDLHDLSDGINSDPLTQFAVLFAAVIHDIDHPGVPNETLAKEDSQMAELYRFRSINEQKSVDIAWELLMDPAYKDLRACIYTNQNELERFRQVVVNCVLATDYLDEASKESREERWEELFPEVAKETPQASPNPSRKRIGNPRATLAIELILQSSELAHAMQHWHVYRKWSECLFFESMDAYKAGRAEKNPAETWYEDELSFFDNYAIPLARKLQGFEEAFGVASNECLNYAIENRDEWAAKGRTIVAEMSSSYVHIRQREQEEDEDDSV